MKRFPQLFFIIAALFISGAFVACENDKDEESAGPMQADKAIAITKSVMDESNMAFSATPSSMKKQLAKPQEQVFDTVVSFTSDSINFEYSLSITYDVTQNDQGLLMTNSLDASGEYDGPRISKNSSYTSDYSILIASDGTAMTMTINGESHHTGSMTLKAFEGNTYQHDITVTYDNISASSAGFSSGSGSISGTVEGPNGTYSIEGSIAFNADGSAELTVNGESTPVSIEM